MGSSVAAMGMVSDSKFHVLAVDDSVIDRKLIEKLLKTSSYQGIYSGWIESKSFWEFWILRFLFFLCIFLFFFSMAVTTVDSGSKALEFLGYDPGNSSIPSVSSNHHHHHQVCFVFCYLIWFFLMFFPIGGFWNFFQFLVGYFFAYLFSSFCCGFSSGSGCESCNYRLLYAWNDWLWFVEEDQGMLPHLLAFIWIPFMFCTAYQMFVEMPLNGNLLFLC